MKKWIKSLIIIAFVFAGGTAHARFNETLPDKNVLVKYRIDVAANISTYVTLVDLSDTFSNSSTTWTHGESGYLTVSSIKVNVDKAAASTDTVKLGVVTYINASTGSVTWFWSKENELNVSNTGTDVTDNMGKSFWNLQVIPHQDSTTEGITPYIFSNDTTNDSTLFQTDLALTSVVSTGTSPGRGDIILLINSGTAALNVVVEVIYASHRP